MCLKHLLPIIVAITLASCAPRPTKFVYIDGQLIPEDPPQPTMVDYLLRAPLAVLVYGLANSSFYSTAVTTEHGTTDFDTRCTFNSCDVTVRDR